MTVGQDERRMTVRPREQTLVDKVKDLVHEGNVRRIVIKSEAGHPVIEIPVTAGLVVAVLAPVVAAAGAIAALANEWSIEVDQQSEPTLDER